MDDRLLKPKLGNYCLKYGEHFIFCKQIKFINPMDYDGNGWCDILLKIKNKIKYWTLLFLINVMIRSNVSSMLILSKLFSRSQSNRLTLPRIFFLRFSRRFAWLILILKIKIQKIFFWNSWCWYYTNCFVTFREIFFVYSVLLSFV